MTIDDHTETPERQNSISTHRDAQGRWITDVKLYFGPVQEDADQTLDDLAYINLRLLAAYPPVDVVQAELLEKHLEMSLTAVRERNDNA